MTNIVENILIDEIDISNRSYNALVAARIDTVEKILFLNAEEVVNIRNLGTTSIEEIINIQNDYSELNIKNPYKNYRGWCLIHKNQIYNYFNENYSLEIQDLGLNYKTINHLYDSGFEYLLDIILLNSRTLDNNSCLSKQEIKEVTTYTSLLLETEKNNLIKYINGIKNIDRNTNEDNAIENINFNTITIPELLHIKKYKKIIIDYVSNKNQSIGILNLSERASNSLIAFGIFNMSQLIDISDIRIRNINNVGKKSYEEIISKKYTYLESIKNELIAQCSGDDSFLFSKNTIKELIVKLFVEMSFAGLSFFQIKSSLPKKLSNEKLMLFIEDFLKEDFLVFKNKLYYVKIRSFYSFVEQYDDIKDDRKEMILLKLNGHTLETLGTMYSVTRERIRQIISKEIIKIKKFHLSKHGYDFFEEDYFAYLFSTYDIPKNIWDEYLCDSKRVYQYLSYFYDKGSKSIDDALQDEKISIQTRLKLQKYINKNKIILDGHLVDKNRSSIENYIISHYCENEMKSNDFAKLYNTVLEKNNISSDSNLYYNDGMLRARENRLADSRFVLWKDGKRLRAYQIDGKDYSELIEELHLNSYRNTEISTLLFFTRYPELMKKYDIRDQYELHNLLKKISNQIDIDDLQFKRQPILLFGEFDRDKMILEIIKAFSPLTADELIEYIFDEYGYSKLFLQMNVLPNFSQYYHNGVYTYDYKKMSEDRKNCFKEKLIKDFYYINELEELYASLFPEADQNELNPHTMKELGFRVYSKYALQNYESLEEYFKMLLLKDDIFDFTTINKSFGNIVSFTETYYQLRRQQEIFLFDKTKIINIRRLEKNGIKKEQIIDYCTNVISFVPEDSFFTIHYLRKHGFSDFLDSLGFDESFYSGILFADNRIKGQRMMGTIVFYKGAEETLISMNNFILHNASKYSKIEIEDLAKIMHKKYGVKVDRQDIITAVNESDLIYSPLFKKIYRSKDEYYSEFEN